MKRILSSGRVRIAGMLPPGTSTLLESSTVGVDARYAGIGSSPYGGQAVPYLPVPASPSSSAKRAYLCLASSVLIPEHCNAWLIGFVPTAIIGLRLRENPESEEIGYDQTVLDPYWRFPDGFVTSFLRWQAGSGRQRQVANGPPNFSNQIQQTTPAWLYRSLDGYKPLNGGLPPGEPLPGLSTIYDLRPRWAQDLGSAEGLRLPTGGRLSAYMSVKQTDPGRARGPLPFSPPTPSRVEDLFVNANPTLVRYTGVAATLLVRVET